MHQKTRRLALVAISATITAGGVALASAPAFAGTHASAPASASQPCRWEQTGSLATGAQMQRVCDSQVSQTGYRGTAPAVGIPAGMPTVTVPAGTAPAGLVPIVIPENIPIQVRQQFATEQLGLSQSHESAQLALKQKFEQEAFKAKQQIAQQEFDIQQRLASEGQQLEQKIAKEELGFKQKVETTTPGKAAAPGQLAAQIMPQVVVLRG
ncbi:hypothetical protein [Planotetraspora sp. GP83]|uniref:hypothetical protein n=1 Tax=Planotetraspora sp. GP83 TaxID=3156264 RepID=UPI003510D511